MRLKELIDKLVSAYETHGDVQVDMHNGETVKSINDIYPVKSFDINLLPTMKPAELEATDGLELTEGVNMEYVKALDADFYLKGYDNFPTIIQISSLTLEEQGEANEA